MIATESCESLNELWNSLVVVTRSHVWKTACDCLRVVEVLLLRSAVCGNPLTLNSRLWRAIRLGPRNGRCIANVATAGECVENATLEAQLRGQQIIAQGLAELPGAITTVVNRAQAPTRRMLVDKKGLGKPPMFSGRERRLLRVGQEGRELRVRCVFPNVRGA